MSTAPLTSSQPNQMDLALWLIIPVKPFGEGKSRLSTILSTTQRAELSRRWLTHLLTTAREWGGFTGIAVISRDPAVLASASEFGALPITEVGQELNVALTQANGVVMAAGAEAVLVLPSDLPLVTSTDLNELYTLSLAGTGVVIAPSHDGGTNALLLRPPHIIEYAFGENSCRHHLALTVEAGLPFHLYRSTTLALDIDHPEDLLVINP